MLQADIFENTFIKTNSKLSFSKHSILYYNKISDEIILYYTKKILNNIKKYIEIILKYI